MKYTPILEVARELETPVPPIYVPDLTTTVGKLKHLRTIAENIPPERFDMDTAWGNSSCGTVGCMLGWATQDEHFQAMGLATKEMKPDPCSDRVNESCGVRFGDVGEFYEAGAALLGVSFDDSNALFTYRARRDDGEGYPLTISHGLARIDRMITKYSAGES